MTLNTDQKFDATVAFFSSSGQPAPVAPYPTWVSANPTVAQVVARPGGTTATVTAGSAGTTVVVVSADADMGPGVVTISGTLDIQVVPAMAVRAVITAGTLSPK